MLPVAARGTTYTHTHVPSHSQGVAVLDPTRATRRVARGWASMSALGLDLRAARGAAIGAIIPGGWYYVPESVAKKFAPVKDLCGGFVVVLQAVPAGVLPKVPPSSAVASSAQK